MFVRPGTDTDLLDEETALEPDFSIFPNPADKEVFLQLKQFDEIQTFSVSLFNSLGQRVYYRAYLDTEDTLDPLQVSKYPNGLYWISIQLDKGRKLTKRLMIGK